MSNNTETKTETKPKGGPLPGLLRPPIVFLFAILSGIALNRAWTLPFMPSPLRLLGPLVTLCAVLLFLLSLREFRAAGTSVRGSKPRLYDRANWSLPVQSQSHLFVFHSARARIVSVAK